MPEPTRDTALDQLARAAYSLSAADSRLRGRATRTPGALSLTHARALRVLAEEGPLPVGRLAAATETTGAATTQLVNGLAAAGYVTRERPAADKRSVLVALTDAGHRRHHDAAKCRTQSNTPIKRHPEQPGQSSGWAASFDQVGAAWRVIAALLDSLPAQGNRAPQQLPSCDTCRCST